MFWEAVRKEPVSYWLMLWSSSGIWEVRKEIGSAQPRWTVKIGNWDENRFFKPKEPDFLLIP